MALTEKQQRFCQEYLIDLNATQAAIRAGYSAKTANPAAARLMANPEIKAKIDRLKEDRCEAAGLTAQLVLNELKLVLLSDLNHYSLDPETGKILLSPNAPAGASRAVSRKRWRRRTVLGPDGKPTNITLEECEISLWDKSAAIKNTLEHLGITKKITLETVLAVLPEKLSKALTEILQSCPDADSDQADS